MKPSLIFVSLQIANAFLLFYTLFLSVNANEKTICICIISAVLHVWDDALRTNLPASFLSRIWQGKQSSGEGDLSQSLSPLSTRRSPDHFFTLTSRKWWNYMRLWRHVHFSLPNHSTSKTNIAFGWVFLGQLGCVFSYHYV
jgi:hypothetical protein